MRRGGIIADMLVSGAIKNIGIDCLRRDRHRLFTSLRRQLITELQRIESERDSFEEILERDLKFDQIVYEGVEDTPAQIQLSDPEESGISIEGQKVIMDLIQQMAARPEEEQHADYRNTDLFVVAMLRMLTLDLAIRQWNEDHGAFPPSLATLNGLLGCEIPMDPYSQRDFVYRNNGDSFDLYGVGDNRFDGEGDFGSTLAVHMGVKDLHLDAYDYEMEWDCESQHSQSFSQRVIQWIKSFCRIFAQAKDDQ